MATLVAQNGGALDCLQQFHTWTYSQGRGSQVIITGDTKSLKAIWLSDGAYTPLFDNDVSDYNWKTIEDVSAYLKRYFPAISWSWGWGRFLPTRVPNVTFAPNPSYQVHVKFPGKKGFSLELAFFDTGHAVKHQLIDRLRRDRLSQKRGYDFSVIEYNGQKIEEDEFFGTHVKKSDQLADIIPRYIRGNVDQREFCSGCGVFFCASSSY
ncbi:MAG: hypothetical protein KDK56_03450 [Simkania sp.]|nr:hypothetical protein [Simkania sp.]MCP5490737.1 hypothetical protein [Chlamydiales bacterium]